MNTKELMVGNYVYEGKRTKFPMKVVALGEDWVYLSFEGNEGDVWDGDLEEMEGIPISGELLESMGFQKDDTIDSITFWRHNDIGVAVHGFKEDGQEKWFWLIDEAHRPSSSFGKFRFLHELQNATSVMLNKSLKINEAILHK